MIARDRTNVDDETMREKVECHRYKVLILSNTHTRSAELGKDGRQGKKEGWYDDATNKMDRATARRRRLLTKLVHRTHA